MSTTPQTLARVDRAPDRITTPDEFAQAIARWQGQAHVLTPYASISGIAPMHAVWMSVVQIDPDKAAGEVYDGRTETGGRLPWLKDGEVALAKNGLRKIAEGLGVDITLQHLSVGVVRHYWHIRAIASYKGLDGGTVTREASMEWDLRDGSERLKGFGPNQIAEARKNGLRNCETRAINAAIRECGCGVKQAYRREELQRPFVAIRVRFEPDYADPETRRLLTERALAGSQALYAPQLSAAPVTRAAFDEVEPSAPQSVGRGTTAAAAGQPPAARTSPPAGPPVATDEPPTPAAVRIDEVKTKSGETNGRRWMRYIIVDSLGVEHSTFDKDIGEAAQRARAARAWVELAEESDGNYKNLVEIAPAGQQPTLPDMGGL